MSKILVVGAGISGATVANVLSRNKDNQITVIDRLSHIGGNCYDYRDENGIMIHKYGSHIFHTSDEFAWNMFKDNVEVYPFINEPIANCHGEFYHMPFNMNTFHELWGVTTAEEAQAKIAEESKEITGEPKNLEEQAISLVGKDIYELLIKGYTEKQWGRKCTELPPGIIKRLPVRLVFDNNYFNDRYQGIPVGGYTAMVEKMLKGCDILLNTDFFDDKGKWMAIADKIVFTGTIDSFYDYKFGKLEYRSLKFETETLDCDNFQGNAVINYTDAETPYTRIIEHKHFEFGIQPKTVITKEYPAEWHFGDEPYYAVNDEKNTALYQKYKKEAEADKKVIFGGRLGMYKYFDMDDTIAAALTLWTDIC